MTQAENCKFKNAVIAREASLQFKYILRAKFLSNVNIFRAMRIWGENIPPKVQYTFILSSVVAKKYVVFQWYTS